MGTQTDSGCRFDSPETVDRGKGPTTELPSQIYLTLHDRRIYRQNLSNLMPGRFEPMRGQVGSRELRGGCGWRTCEVSNGRQQRRTRISRGAGVDLGLTASRKTSSH